MSFPSSAPASTVLTLTAAIEQARAMVDQARGDSNGAELLTVDDGVLLDLLRQVGALRRSIDSIGVHAAGEVARRSRRVLDEPLSARMGERTESDLVARTAGVPTATATQWCALGVELAPSTALSGEALPAPRPLVRAAIDSCELSTESATVIVRGLDELAPFATTDELIRAEAFLVDEARHLSARQLHRLCGALRDRFDQKGVEPREDELRRRAGLKISRSRDGLVRWVVDLHPEAAGFLTAALDARTAPKRVRFVDEHDIDDAVERDGRTLPQKRLDALVSLARDALKRDGGDVSGTAVTMLVTVPLETLLSGVGAAHIAGVDEPVCAATARRLAAGAEIIPAVLGGDSEVLDLGRARRLHSSAQRRAMAVRDGGCVWPGCDAPPSWCEAAHSVSPWAHGGRTDLSNGALLCGFHHRRLDNDGWELRIERNRPYLIPPAHVDPSRRPRRGGRERAPAQWERAAAV